MATTWIKPLHVNKGKNIAQTIKDRTDYAENGDKTNDGELVSSYECAARTAEIEFILAKNKYEHITGRNQGKHDILAYHIRQAFKPGEITPEKANELGYELAKRFTKGKHSFIVATHIDKSHVHNHIIFNSTTLDCTHKFNNFWRSTDVIRRLSDFICAENNLSIVENPKRGRKGYTKVNLVIDIQGKIREGKGAGYENWAKIFNLKQHAKTLMFLHENDITDYEDLVKRHDEVSEDFNARNKQIKKIDDRLNEIKTLQKYIGQYSKTKDTYAKYKASNWSKKFYAEHEGNIILYKAAGEHFKKYCAEHNLQKIPRIKELQQEFAELLAEKKKLYVGYKDLKAEQQQLMVAKHNADILLHTTERQRQQGNEYHR